ncbi:MAG: MBL fold metallo-hydrolase [Desulfomonilaceae bacterium]
MSSISRISATEIVFRILVGLVGLFFVALGIGFMAFPDIFAVVFSVEPAYASGVSGIRSDFGGLFLGMSFFCLIGAMSAPRWLAVPIIFLLVIIAGRLIDIGLDGFSSPGSKFLMVELVLVVILMVALALKRRSNEKSFRVSELLNLKTLVAAAVVAAIVGSLFLFQKKIGLGLVERIAAKSMNVDVIAGLPDGLHVGLCGSGAPFADPRRACSCVAVIAGRSFYVIDIGPSSERKMELMRLNPGKVTAVFLTHFHSDHIGDLGELMLKRWAGGSNKSPLEVFGPAGVETVVQGFNLAYSLDSKYRILHHGPETVPPTGAGCLAKPFHFPPGQNELVIIDADGVRITAFQVDHAPVEPAVGYRFNYKDRSVVISGDTAPCQSMIHQAKGTDLLVHEALQPAMVRILEDLAQKNGLRNTARIMADIQRYHTSPEDAAKIAKEAGVRHLLLTHIVPPLPVSMLKTAFLGDAQKISNVPITIAEDGMLLTLPAGNKKILKRSLL